MELYKLPRMRPALAVIAMTLTFSTAESAHSKLRAPSLNAYVLDAVASMPVGGGYSVKEIAGQGLQGAVSIKPDLGVDARNATPSFCTTATYLVFLKVIERLQNQGALSLGAKPSSVLAALAPPSSIDSLFKDDGRGVWGRWNANGPGTGRFFYETGLGTNFTDKAKRKAGDFMKIWWTEAVGGKEKGHSVVYLGARKNPQTGDPEVQYWSSNQSTGYGKAWVSETKIKHALYSRLDHPSSLKNVAALPEWDTYLKNCASVDSSFEEAKAMSGAP